MINDKELVVLYIRVPNDNEEMIKQQEFRLRKYCDLKNYKVQDVYVDFNCHENIENPKLLDLKKDIKLGKVKNVITCSVDRISRNHLVIMSFLETLYSNYGNFETLDKFDMKSYIGKTKTSLFTFFNTLKEVQKELII